MEEPQHVQVPAHPEVPADRGPRDPGDPLEAPAARRVILEVAGRGAAVDLDRAALLDRGADLRREADLDPAVVLDRVPAAAVQ